MSETQWTPDQPLRVEATDEQIKSRDWHLFTNPSDTLCAVIVARELVAAETAALRARIRELETAIRTLADADNDERKSLLENVAIWAP